MKQEDSRQSGDYTHHLEVSVVELQSRTGGLQAKMIISSASRAFTCRQLSHRCMPSSTASPLRQFLRSCANRALQAQRRHPTMTVDRLLQFSHIWSVVKPIMLVSTQTAASLTLRSLCNTGSRHSVCKARESAPSCP